MTLTEAIRELRKRSGKSQQVFATELKMSIRALQKYEYGQTPELKQLMALYVEAVESGHADLAQVIGDGFQEYTMPPRPGWSVLFQIQKLPPRQSKGNKK